VTDPWLTVITPTYNGAAYLAAMLDSIVAQGDGDIECIAVDGGSSDETLSILRAYRGRLPLQILERAELKSWMASSNYALSLARGEYACFLHQDDLWLEGRLRTMRQLALEHPNIPFLLHPSIYIDNGGKALGRWSCPLPAAPGRTPSALMMERLLVQNFISMPGPVFKREPALSVGGLDEALWYAADWDFWLKLAACGDVLYHPRALSGFRLHANSQTMVRSSDPADFRRQLDQVAERHLAVWQAGQPLRRQVRRAALFSNEVNTALAGAMHDRGRRPYGLLASFLRLGPSTGYRYLRDSRIWERASARMRGQLLATSNAEQSRANPVPR
jgi:glycosyltransferase involved in cell wall biosynthesis